MGERARESTHTTMRLAWMASKDLFIDPADNMLSAKNERGRRQYALMAPELGLRIYLAFAWMACGFPTIEPSPELAASLMATSLGDVDSLDLPWPTFAVRVPRGLLSIDSQLGPIEVTAVFLRTVPSGAINVSVAGCHDEAGLPFDEHAFHPATTIAELLRDPDDIDVSGTAFVCSADLSDRDRRTLWMAGRLVVGCALELASMPTPRRPRATVLSDRAAGTGTPKLAAYTLARPVRVDCRAMVAEYVKGGGRSPLVRSMVRGHWKRQPCGPRGELRRWLHVEPYWRGPEDAPIAVRPHVVRGTDMEAPRG